MRRFEFRLPKFNKMTPAQRAAERAEQVACFAPHAMRALQRGAWKRRMRLAMEREALERTAMLQSELDGLVDAVVDRGEP